MEKYKRDLFYSILPFFFSEERNARNIRKEKRNVRNISEKRNVLQIRETGDAFGRSIRNS